ncbi:MAG: hypothetical protein K1X28_07825 [Parachlamydiales bacterium]|nr:hypothetical protein [Parachlamydiales bacterium]
MAVLALGPRINPVVLDPANRTENSSLMQRIYTYFKDESNPILIKISLAALGALTALAAGVALGNILLTFSAISVVVILGTALEANRLKEETLARQISALQLRHMMSGQDRFLNRNLPELDIGDRESPTGDIIIQAEEVPAPKRGTDKYGRQFYAFQVESIEGNRHVVVLFQKYTTGDVWHVSGPEDFVQGPLNDAAKDQIAHALFERDHPRYNIFIQQQAGDVQ